MQRCVLEHCGDFSCASRLSSQGICRVAGRDRFSVPAKLDSHTQLILTHATLEIEKTLLIFKWLAKNPILVLVLSILSEILYDNAPVSHLGTFEIIRKTNKGLLPPVSTLNESAGLFSNIECWNAKERFRTRPTSIERV
jgi:hypothetical protein